jgi:flagellar biosynthesis/type III secretory pathway chaperone
MSDELFEQIKDLLVENEYLFNKLHKVGQQYESIEFDESGLYEEEEEAVIRRWSKLSSKIEANLNDNLEILDVKIADISSPQHYILKLKFIPEEDEEFSSLNIDYSKIGELSIIKV